MIETKTINRPAGVISYRKVAEVNKKEPLLIFIHGAGGDSLIYQSQLKFFNKKYNAIAIDLPAHGASELSQLPTLQDYIETINQVIIKEQVDTIILIGHSMGGGICLEFYKQYKEKITGLIFLSSYAYSEKHIADDLISKMDADYDSFCEYIINAFYSIQINQQVKSFLKTTLKRTNKESYKNDLLISKTYDFRDLLPQIDIPVLCIANKNDTLIPIERTEFIFNETLHSHMVSFELDGHMPHIEEDDKCNEAIEDFITSIVLANNSL